MGTPDVERSRRAVQPDDYFQQVLNSLTSGVIVLDRHGYILSVNRGACVHLHTDPNSLGPGMRFDELPLAGPLVDVMREVTVNRTPVTRREIVFTLEGGGRKEIGLSASLLEGPESFNGVIFLFTDMTERRSLERAAEVSRQLATLGELTAGVVHELRNPIMVISGMAELLMRKAQNDAGLLDLANTIFEEAQGLERSISQFLGFAKPYDYQPVHCEASEIVQRAVRLCKRRAQNKEIGLASEVGANLPPMQADVGRAAQALVNIINNAIDAAAAGGRVDVCAWAEGSDMVFTVTDDGEGISVPPDGDIFAPFYTLKEGGTGLGLTIVHRIVTAHGGKVGFANLEPRGCRFEVRLPLEPPARRT